MSHFKIAYKIRVNRHLVFEAKTIVVESMRNVESMMNVESME